MAIPDTISYSEFRANLATYLDNVVDDSLPLVVKRRNGKRVVIVDADEYNRMDETAHLLSTKANRKHLEEALNSKDFITYTAEEFREKYKI